ncbi:unnamed protein product [Schistosoma turkestanicum]|nr:unnamed protein product [Schistosoma turkestanicum]
MRLATVYFCFSVCILRQVLSKTVKAYEGQDISLTCNLHLINGHQLYWTIRDETRIGIDNRLDLWNIQKDDEGIYKCFYANTRGGSESIVVRVFNVDNKITKNVTEGTSADISCNTDNIKIPSEDSSLLYRWINPIGEQIGYERNFQLPSMKASESGIYVCLVASKDNKRKLIPSSATEINVIPREIIRLEPGRIQTKPYKAFTFQCYTSKSDLEPTVRFQDLRIIDSDPRFHLISVRPGIIQVEVNHGLTERDDDTSLSCMLFNRQQSNYMKISVERSCPDGQLVCADGTCLSKNVFCDGKVDCLDGSDEKLPHCSDRHSKAMACKSVGNIPPREATFEFHWKCDGEDDCGNKFDETNCQKIGRCNNDEFHCYQSNKNIPYGQWCDDSDDCENGEDEFGCDAPVIISPQHPNVHTVRQGGDLSLGCEVSGVPNPVVVWRFNKRLLVDDMRVTSDIVQCSAESPISTSYLSIQNFTPDDIGIYNCEAVNSKGSVMSQDFKVTLSA